jgi:succinate dehydrogenase/fumarate reductase flavoprotein subunit
MKELTEKTYQTDVLVVGAGGAGLRAAIEARNAGADVLIVSKGDYPNGCVTAVAMGAMSARHWANPTAPTAHYEDTIKGGTS